ncbi:MAG: hypothetical protein IBJ10_08500 [Phycisphaerales bacterium]|nr:hypothetical protein [Phycisphaerales bacterium]
MTKRIDIDAQIAEARRPIDANWTKRKKLAVGGGAGAVAVLALAGGVWAAVASREPGMPRSADDVLAALSSPKFAQMSNDRKSQYLDEARRIMRDMSEEDRAKLRDDERARKAFEQMREEMFDEMARRFARGEPMPWAGQPGTGERREGPSPEEMRRRREEMEKMTDEERAKMREQFRQRMNQQFDSQVSGGNAQSGGLRSEMFKRGGGMRGGGGGRPGGGGGPRGG